MPDVSHHETCVFTGIDPTVDTCLQVTVGHREDGSVITVVRFASGQQLMAEAGNPDLGLGETDETLHDIAHTFLACKAGVERSPVLERVVDIAPLSQAQVDLEEAATFAFQAWCLSLEGRDPAPAVNNARKSLSSWARQQAAPVPGGR